ncbi:response regulator receiver protein [Parvibaculum lavamentivorans DS-1]|uniref:Response regulator receiver protein n=1 Tax=Parvibaculum lavamentivorans (strain DS-1 / DSM 13023 / NCIMB 13966) TaxID=402881 RepID=A7HVQ8_PARL1|nr:response regulator [Parvibaculum lavamentivorans]ABS63991.1 response regulator receiver protein [Parvibaculum lavamentivorans DS-1]
MLASAMVAVVDDDESAREAIVELVRALGYEALGFSSGENFLLSDGRRRTACLITDMRMPNMSGLQLHAELVAAGTWIPTILVSAHEDDATRIQALNAGMLFYLSKPLDPEELLRCLRAAMGERN